MTVLDVLLVIVAVAMIVWLKLPDPQTVSEDDENSRRR